MANYIEIMARFVDAPDVLQWHFLVNAEITLRSFSLMVGDLFGPYGDDCFGIVQGQQFTYDVIEDDGTPNGKKRLQDLGFAEGESMLLNYGVEEEDAYSFECTVLSSCKKPGNALVHLLGSKGGSVFQGCRPFFMRFIKEKNVPASEFPDCVDYISYEEWSHLFERYEHHHLLDYKVENGFDVYFAITKKELQQECLGEAFDMDMSQMMDDPKAERKLCSVLRTDKAEKIPAKLDKAAKEYPFYLPMILENIYWKRAGIDAISYIETAASMLIPGLEENKNKKSFYETREGLFYTYIHTYTWLIMMDEGNYKGLEKELKKAVKLGAPMEFVVPMQKKLYLMQGRYEEHQAYCKEHPHRYDIFDEAFILMKQGKLNEALLKADEGEAISRVVADAFRYANFDGFENRSPFLPRAYGKDPRAQGASYFLSYGAKVTMEDMMLLAQLGSTRLLKEQNFTEEEKNACMAVIFIFPSSPKEGIPYNKFRSILCGDGVDDFPMPFAEMSTGDAKALINKLNERGFIELKKDKVMIKSQFLNLMGGLFARLEHSLKNMADYDSMPS